MRYFAFISLFAGVLASFAQPVTVSSGEITIPTYIIYGSDVNPKFYDFDGSILYPYTMQDDLGEDTVDATYQAWFLENEYLKIICLPQLGGRIHSVFNKITNTEMFHRNDVIKPGLIAMRGAWISGGIEWNRGPQGHTVTSFSSVSVTSQKHGDESASLFIGYTERNFGTRWSVRLTLHPGKAYLHETIRLLNPNDGVYSYYFWNCTAFPCKPGTRFIYPMSLGQDHNGTSFFSWPVHNGKDMTWLKNYDEPSSVFAYQCAFDFFGAYDVDDDRGIVQFGDHRVLTGKKAWTWGQSGDGIASQRALHDDDSQYIEVQSGPLQTQADFGLLGPRQHIAWQEWWYPVHGLGDGFEYATRDVAIQTHRKDGQIEVRAIATGIFPGAVISVREIRSQASPGAIETVDLTPATPRIVSTSAAEDAPVAIEIRSAEGQILAQYTSPLDIPMRTPPPPLAALPESPAVEELYLQGVKHEERIEPRPARESYEKAIAQDPGYTRARVALARLELGRARYTSAVDHARAAIARDPGEGMAWYYLGCALLELPEEERDGDPMDAAYRTVNSIEHASLGHDLAGRIHMRANRFQYAVNEFSAAVLLDLADVRAREHLMAAQYASGDNDGAVASARAMLDTDPLNIVSHGVIALASGRASDLYEFAKYMQDHIGLYEFETVDLAFFFADLGMHLDALRVLEEAYSEHVPNQVGILYRGNFTDMRQRPLPWYVLAWLAVEIGNSGRAQEFLAKGKVLDPEYAFPADTQYLAVLDNAVALDPEDANAWLFRGNLHAGFSDMPRAVADWETSAALPAASSIALRNLAMHAWKIENDLEKSAALFRRAIELRERDQPLYRDLATVLVANGKHEEAVTLLTTMPLDHPQRGDIVVLLARTYNDLKRYDDAIELLKQSRFSNWELNTESWRAFHRAHIERGKLRFEEKDFAGALDDFETSLTYPENLGVGRAARPEESEGLYWKGKALEALGRADEARAAWTEGANGAEKSDRQKEYIGLCKEALE